MKKRPEYKDPHIEHHYPSSTKNKIFHQYFQWAAYTKGEIGYFPIHTICVEWRNGVYRGKGKWSKTFFHSSIEVLA